MNPYTSATPSSAKAVPRSLLDSSGNGSDGVNAVHRALLRSMNQRPHCRLVWAAMKAITTRGPISPAAGNERRIGAENDQDAHDRHRRGQAPVDDVQQGIVAL